MSTGNKTALAALDTRLLRRILDEGYGPGAWHGPDLKQALAGVPAKLAFWRPAPGRHNIAEIAIHHAYYAHAVLGQLAGGTPEPFVLEGDDWFPLEDDSALTWPRILEVVATGQERLARLLARIDAGDARPALPEEECLKLVLGIACHAVYHAGQVQLIKRLAEGQ
jgi:hypothetical protein